MKGFGCGFLLGCAWGLLWSGHGTDVVGNIHGAAAADRGGTRNWAGDWAEVIVLGLGTRMEVVIGLGIGLGL